MKRVILGLLVLVAAAGCGVQPTGAIPGLPAPTGPALAPGVTTVYWVRDGALTPVQVPGVMTVSQSLQRLIDGPPPAGLTSAVPPDTGPATATVDGIDRVVVTLRTPVDALPAMAVDQLVCTAGAAFKGRAQVVLIGAGSGDGGARVCPER